MNFIDAAALRTLIEENPNLVVIDVRTLNEFKHGRIPQTHHVELGSILGDTDGAMDRIQELTHGQEPIYVTCLSDQRSQVACKTLEEAGLRNLIYVVGGTKRWVESGYPEIIDR